GEFGTLAEAEHRAQQAGIEVAPAYVVAALVWGGQLPAAATHEIGRWSGSATVFHRGSLIVVLQVLPGRQHPLDDGAAMVGRVAELISPPGRRIAVGLGGVAGGGAPAASHYGQVSDREGAEPAGASGARRPDAAARTARGPQGAPPRTLAGPVAHDGTVTIIGAGACHWQRGQSPTVVPSACG